MFSELLFFRNITELLPMSELSVLSLLNTMRKKIFFSVHNGTIKAPADIFASAPKLHNKVSVLS